MNVKNSTKKLLAMVTAAGVLTIGGATAAFATDGSTSVSSGTASATTGRPGAVRYAIREAIRTAFGAVADTLGMTPRELRVEMQNGPRSIADIAGDQTAAVEDAIVSALSARIDQAVANGNFPPERVDGAKGRLPQFAERFVNHVPRSRAPQ